MQHEDPMSVPAAADAEPATDNLVDRGPWRPLLEGAEADTARATILEIVETLRGDPDELTNPGLCEGAAGRALFFGYLADAWPGQGFSTIAEDYLDRAIDLLGEQPLGWGLYSGATGIAWTAQHLVGRFNDALEADDNHEIDEALIDVLSSSPWPQTTIGHYDLISGLCGQGVYALERLPRGSAAGILELVIDRLGDETTLFDRGVTWLTKPEHIGLASTRRQHPNGYYNLGVAHGVPAIIAVLAGARAAGVKLKKAEALYHGAVAWTLGQQLGPESPSAFPYWVSDAGPPDPARAAWCYGDPGVAATLLAAANLAGDAALAHAALAVGRRAAVRPVDHTGVGDAMICHGSAGLAHLYNRLWQSSSDPLFADAARTFYKDIQRWRRPDRGVAGFQAWSTRPQGGLGWVDDRSFLTGVLGVGLTLLAAVTSVEPAWDRVLLASLPSRR
jgi:lantibiotic modifying enzyme